MIILPCSIFMQHLLNLSEKLGRRTCLASQPREGGGARREHHNDGRESARGSRDTIFPGETQQGFISLDVDSYLHRMQASYTFKASTGRERPVLKQIIPCWLMRSGCSLSSDCLRSRNGGWHVPIGIGGHINKDDAADETRAGESDAARAYLCWEGMNREIREEVFVGEDPELSLAGLINDDSTPVGQVHLGLVYLARLSEPCVAVRETELMVGSFAPVSALGRHYAAMETWSQIVIDSGCLRSQGRG